VAPLGAILAPMPVTTVVLPREGCRVGHRRLPPPPLFEGLAGLPAGPFLFELTGSRPRVRAAAGGRGHAGGAAVAPPGAILAPMPVTTVVLPREGCRVGHRRLPPPPLFEGLAGLPAGPFLFELTGSRPRVRAAAGGRGHAGGAAVAPLGAILAPMPVTTVVLPREGCRVGHRRLPPPPLFEGLAGLPGEALFFRLRLAGVSPASGPRQEAAATRVELRWRLWAPSSLRCRSQRWCYRGRAAGSDIVDSRRLHCLRASPACRWGPFSFRSPGVSPASGPRRSRGHAGGAAVAPLAPSSLRCRSGMVARSRVGTWIGHRRLPPPPLVEGPRRLAGGALCLSAQRERAGSLPRMGPRYMVLPSPGRVVGTDPGRNGAGRGPGTPTRSGSAFEGLMHA
jgi:hypothetical protein